MSNELPPQNDALEGIMKSDELIHSQFEALTELMKLAARKPTADNLGDLKDALDAHIHSVRIGLKDLDDESLDPQNIEVLTTYAKGFDDKWTELFNEHDPDTDYESQDFRHMQEHMLADIDDEDGEIDDSDYISDIISDAYEGSLGENYSEFVQSRLQAYIDNPAVRRVERAKQLGAHALDVAKIAAGTAIGVSLVAMLRNVRK